MVFDSGDWREGDICNTDAKLGNLVVLGITDGLWRLQWREMQSFGVEGRMA
jgi:hypothetical protein